MRIFLMTDYPRFSIPGVGALRTLFLTVMVSSVLLGADRGNDRAPEANSAGTTAASEGGEDEEAVVSLGAYNVKADRIEDFGIRIVAAPYPDAAHRVNAGTMWFKKFAPVILTVIPNTAAEKAGLQPGERILESDGRSTVGGLFSTGKFGQWSKSQKKKWADASAGKTRVTWTLQVESPQTKAVRTVELVVPTAAPRWGASTWRMPPGRQPSVVEEKGPLAENSRVVLDNGIATLLPWPQANALLENPTPGSWVSVTGYEWRLENERCQHRMMVTQLRGRTWVFFQTDSPTTGRLVYLTSPSGVLEKAWRWGRKENITYLKAKTAKVASEVGVVRAEEAKAGFEHELDLWATKMRKLSPRWPLELTPGFDPDAIFAVLAQKNGGAPVAAAPSRILSPDFLKLPTATPEQQALFSDAYGKLGAEQDHWAYTETSRTLGDKRVLVTRVDPSQHERCTLLTIDGRPPTTREVEDWRDDGGDVPKALGDLPPLASLVDLKDLRVNRDEPSALLFELPTRDSGTEFPAEKFQALFRVNKETRGFEEITVQLRDSIRVVGVVKVTEAGLHVRFETLDPTHPPQPVHLKGGGTARLALVKISRDFETTRTDFRRVVPFEEIAIPAN